MHLSPEAASTAFPDDEEKEKNVVHPILQSRKRDGKCVTDCNTVGYLVIETKPLIILRCDGWFIYILGDLGRFISTFLSLSLLVLWSTRLVILL